MQIGEMNLAEMKSFILDRTRGNAGRFGDKLPTATEGGRYKFAEDGFWVGGFWVGLNLMCYAWSRDTAYLDAARAGQRKLLRRLKERPDTLDHDAGFLYHLAFTADYKVTGSAEARAIALEAADLLAKRHHPRGKFINAWNVWKPGDAFSENNRGRIIIDCMYNLPLLFWAAEASGNAEWRRIAADHADVSARTLVRPDYTTYHTYLFDPVTGAPVRGETHQGHADDSCWSRGQAWALGGYAHAYRYTKNPAYLELSKKLADVYLELADGDDVPPWDFALTGKKDEPLDASAAVIAAAGLLEIAEHVQGAEQLRYRQEAARIAEGVYRRCGTRAMTGQEGLLVYACGNKPKQVDLDGSLIYGDFYFAEVVGRLSGLPAANLW